MGKPTWASALLKIRTVTPEYRKQAIPSHDCFACRNIRRLSIAWVLESGRGALA